MKAYSILDARWQSRRRPHPATPALPRGPVAQAPAAAHGIALATPMSTQPVTAREIAAPSTMKLRLPVISLKTKTPHSEETMPGPEVMSGKATATESEALATNHAVWAAAHMRPERKPGKMTRG